MLNPLRRNSLLAIASCIAIAIFLAFSALPVLAGGLIRAPAVGGVYIDAEGVVSSPSIDETERLRAIWQAGLDPIPGDMETFAEQRFVSLRGLDEQIAAATAAQEPLPDAVRYLAGLLRVEHVLVYPPTEAGGGGDIVLAGPAEGWKVDSLGNTVGASSNRPVLMLEDLIVALRSGESSNETGISCSIDPTAEGLARAQRIQRSLNPSDGPETAARRLEQALGRQSITVAGVPASSHFARSLVAADFRMKRLAMGFEPSNVEGLPSYVDSLNARKVSKSLLPRWWLAPNYEPLARDAEGLAWEIRGQGVKCMAEEDLLSSDGSLERGRGDASDAREWAQSFTERFEQLTSIDSAFGHVRNAMDLAVVAALLAKESLWDVAQCDLPRLTSEYDLERYDTPKSVATSATFFKKGRQWVITASGGVQIYPWQIADRVDEAESLRDVREMAAAKRQTAWWWQ